MVQGTVSSAGSPAPWQEVHAEGLTYYWNTETNVTQYERPVAGQASKPAIDYSYLGGATEGGALGNNEAGGEEEYNAPPPRFHITPNNVRWGRALGLIDVGAYNTLAWRGGEPPPPPPPLRTPPALPPTTTPPTTTPTPPTAAAGRCWLLPATDDAALAIARQRRALRAAGWRVLACAPELVEALSNKAHFPRSPASCRELP